ncbi:hypothetical protein B9Z55_027309 [Caenorhabditis nigoni]|uniref:Uncharacterized protein n=1 Tax=Caenorhabditis nigoni TaxID=1611254 RepID=A0A2G5SGD1_9PELO|nr:hypothetical protein B9Z55_027309 [Caenorhabditis nigoni]
MTDSSWSTIDQLLDRTCAQIEQENVLFNNRDLDVFLRKWKKAGTFPIDNESPIQEMIPPIRTVIKPMIRVSADPADTLVEEFRKKTTGN